MEDDRAEYLKRSHDIAMWMISLADTKASILAGGAAVFLALIMNRTPPLSTWAGLLTLAGVFAVVASVLGALLCLWPRIGRPTSNPLFFTAVARMRLDEYKTLVLAGEPRKLGQDLAEENHALARVQFWKYWSLRAATAFLFSGVSLVVLGWVLGPT